jgi:hypothetical protein
MSKQIIIGSIILTLSLISFSAFATDYSSMETSELASLRGTMCNATPEDQEAFRTEWQLRVSGDNSGTAKMHQNRSKNRTGSGNGNQYKASGTECKGKAIRNTNRANNRNNMQ